MKLSVAIMFLIIGLCVACASRPTSSQAIQNSSPVPVSSPTPTPDAVVSDKVPCGLVMDQAPIMNGIRLGMTPEQVMAVFPGSKEDPEVQAELSRPTNQFGGANFLIRPDKYESDSKFRDVRQISLTLLDGLVSNFTVGYNGPEWSHVDKFVERFTQGTNLPSAGAWEAYVGLDTQMKTLTCTDFEVRIFAGGAGGNLNYVLMRDLEADKKLKKRMEEARKKATPGQ